MLDLVEIAPTAKPPVCKMMDYGKHLYRESKTKAIAKAKQVQMQVKEIKLRPVTEQGDLDVKMRHASRFLKRGDKVKVTLRFRGRELAHQEIARELMKKIQEQLVKYGDIEQCPKMEGRQMIMIVVPKKKQKG